VVSEGQVSEDELKSHVKGNLPKYKVPREIEFVEELPATRRAMSTRSSSGRATTRLTPTSATANGATSAGLVRWELVT
jgi:acyl-CoA synthetase (AMP-forming)/AMP-acid ligase II